MANTPRKRHSKSSREPVTIDLEADAISREAKQPAEESKSVELPEGFPAGGAEGASAAEAQGLENEAASEKDGPQGVPETEEGTTSTSRAKPEDMHAESGPAESTHPAPEPAEPVRRGGFGRPLAAGIVGGAVALAAGGALQWAGVIPFPGQAGADLALEGLRQEMAGLQGELAQLRQVASGGVSDEALQQALSEPRQQIANLESQLGQLRDTVAALEQAPAGEGGGNANLQQLQQRLADLENRVSQLAEATGAQAVADRVARVEQRLDNAARTADATQQSAAENAQRLEQVENQVSQLTGQVSQLGAQITKQDEGPKLALIVAASALKSAVERGAPFAGELETYSALAPDAAELAPLQPYAETGIPTEAELAAEAPQVASRIARLSSSVVPPDAGFLDRLWASARSVVSVRPVGEVEGDAPEAIAARMEAAVERGDYARALAEYETLPADAREVAQDFAEKLRARQAADDVLQKALSGALKPA